MIQTLHFGIFLTLLMLLFAADTPAFAERDDRGRGNDRGHSWNRDWNDRRYDYYHHRRPPQRTVIVRPNVITIWPGNPHAYHAHPSPGYYYGPQEVNMTCALGKEVTIRATGLSLDHMLDKANQFCLSQVGGKVYRPDLVSGNRYCREYQSNLTIGGETKRNFGRACLQPDGSWQIVH